MGDETIYLKKAKEWREWTTFLFSVVTPPLVVIGGWIIHLMLANERLENTKLNDATYVHQTNYNDDKSKLEKSDATLWEKVASTNERLGTLQNQVGILSVKVDDISNKVTDIKQSVDQLTIQVLKGQR